MGISETQEAAAECECPQCCGALSHTQVTETWRRLVCLSCGWVSPRKYLDAFGRPVNPDETPADWEPPRAA